MRGKQTQAVQVGERTNPAGKPVSNKILLSISAADYRKIRPHLEFVDLPDHLNLHEPREKLEFAYFLNRGLVSLVVATQEGKEAEAGVVGCEGIVGTPLAVGLYRSPLREVVQIEGNGFRVSASALQAVLQTAPDLQMSLSRYAVLQGMQVAQTAACNRLHELVQRLARWLLMAQDRVDAGTLFLTHDFLATMLGTDRPSVSLAASELQKNKQIRYRRGAVEIVNRKKLETSACECYQVIQQLNGQLGLK
ncbi:MAG TPA: Crp/Fnr family transcriptional regulator [Terriglobia bacterium]|nr:Crp/Fnr family transcriptional regulator [Terriglobia bacterium]